ncbi:MAG: MFS transporter [Syntrophothermus sp.]|uniref:MFS transporter n=1 Tax=Syntrophothermus sp. TaxID=2736299 RepID=UPI00257AC5CC|nr:MFS transporter [Syntrophothermus sp.]NSW84305.1 MFS transporter [Syntrophothermus sp.]
MILANTLVAVGAGLVNPLFTRYLEALGATPQVVGGIMAVDYVLLSFGLVGGYVADKIGRRRFIVLTHCFFPLILSLFLLARNWVWVLVGMCLLGIRVAALPALDAVMADHTANKERGRIYSLNWLAVTVATIVSSFVVGAVVHQLGVYQGTRLGFLIYMVLALAVAILFWARLKDSNRSEQKSVFSLSHLFHQLAYAAKSSSPVLRQFMTYYLLYTPAAGMLTTYYVLYLVHVAGVSDSTVAVTYGIANGVYLITQLLLGPFADRLNRVLVLVLVLTVILLSSLVLIAFHKLAAVAILSTILVLSGISVALYLHKVVLADLTDRQQRATLFGVFSTLVAAEGALSLVAGGKLFELNPHYPFALSAFCLLLAIFTLKSTLLGCYKSEYQG